MNESEIIEQAKRREREGRREIWNTAGFDEIERGQLLALLRVYKAGGRVEYDDDDFPIGAWCAIKNVVSSFHGMIGRIVAVGGQAGEWPITVELQRGEVDEDGRTLQTVVFELWEVEVME